MADTLTPNIKLTNQTEGGNNNTWGTIADANFEFIDNKFGDTTSISTTGSSTTLTETQETVQIIDVSGTLVSDATIVFSGRGSAWIIRNRTSGSFTVTAKVSGQSGVVIDQSTSQPIACNGTDIFKAGGPDTATAIPSGFIADYVGTSAPTGWVRGNGRTIGNASSGATERANADTETLYTLLWNSFSNSVLAIQDSAGSATSRGASAAIDYAANKRLPLPDYRGRVRVGLDAMGNSAAGRIGTIITSSTTNGATGGSETVTLSISQIPSHDHGLGSHTHAISITSGVESNDHTHTLIATTSIQTGTHTHTGTTDSGGIHTHTYQVAAFSGTNAGAGGNSLASGTSTSTTGSDGAHTHAFTTGVDSGSHTHSINAATTGRSLAHTHLVSGTSGASSGNTDASGGGGAHSNMPPAWLGTVIIKV